MNDDYDYVDDLDVDDAEFDHDAFDDYWSDAALERCDSCGGAVSDDEIEATPDLPRCHACIGMGG